MLAPSDSLQARLHLAHLHSLLFFCAPAVAAHHHRVARPQPLVFVAHLADQLRPCLLNISGRVSALTGLGLSQAVCHTEPTHLQKVTRRRPLSKLCRSLERVSARESES